MIRGSRTSAKSQPREAVHATQIPLLIELLGKPTNLGSKVRLGAFPFKTLRFEPYRWRRLNRLFEPT